MTPNWHSKSICWENQKNKPNGRHHTKFFYAFDLFNTVRLFGLRIWRKKSIENVPRRATKSNNGFKNFSYQDRLSRLNLPTFGFRRLRNDMIEIYKHFEVYDKEITPTSQQRTRPSRSHNRMLISPIAREGVQGVQHNPFYYQSVTTWNNLPKDIPVAPSVYSFKRQLGMVAWKDNLLKYLEN